MSGPYGDFHPIFDSKKEMMWVGGGAGMAPVSYTHLDVYKRQIQIHTTVGVGRDVTAVVCQQETEAVVEVVIAISRTACLFVRGFVHQELAGLRQVVVIDVDLRSDVYKRQASM